MGALKVKGVVVCFAGFMHLAFSCWGAGPGSPEVLAAPSRRTAFSSGVGDLGSSSTGPDREATITLSPLMVINRAMHWWSSLRALHRTPGLSLDASALGYSALARANIFSWWTAQKFCGLEEGEQKSCGWSLGMADRVFHQPEASCASGSLKAVTCHKA